MHFSFSVQVVLLLLALSVDVLANAGMVYWQVQFTLQSSTLLVGPISINTTIHVAAPCTVTPQFLITKVTVWLVSFQMSNGNQSLANAEENAATMLVAMSSVMAVLAAVSSSAPREMNWPLDGSHKNAQCSGAAHIVGHIGDIIAPVLLDHSTNSTVLIMRFG